MRPLEGMRVGISGAIPDPADLASHGWSDFDIRMTVLRCVEHILQDGGRIVHGSHPSFVPIIRTAAGTQSEEVTASKPVEMFVVLPYITEEERVTLAELHGSYANLRFVGTPKTGLESKEDLDKRQDQSLDEMRHQFIGMVDALVCIGGRGKRPTRKVPGVEVEVKRAVQNRKPVYLAAGVGGFTQRVRKSLKNLPANGLASAEESLLGTSADPTAIVPIIAKGLRAVWSEHRA
jgi:SLOG cluster2